MADDAQDRPTKLSMILQSGEVDKVHYALATASAALAINIPVTLFFTMAACNCLIINESGAGWRYMTTAKGLSGAEMDNALATRNLGQMEDLITACASLGARFIVCEMGLKAMDLKHEDLRGDIGVEIAGLVTFLSDTRVGGQVIFI